MWRMWVTCVLALAWAVEPARSMLARSTLARSTTLAQTDSEQSSLTQTDGEQPPLRCRHSRCRFLDSEDSTAYNYDIDGYKMSIRTDVVYRTGWINYDSHERTLSISCSVETNDRRELGAVGVLESPAMPRAEPPLRVSLVQFDTCPMPTGALAAVLAALNVTLQDVPGGARSTLTIQLRKDDPPLNPNHFTGLDHLAVLIISGDSLGLTARETEPGFLAPLRSLQEVKLKLSTYELPVTSSIDWLLLREWKERQPARLERCDSLIEIHLERIHAVALPEGWLADCGKLQQLVIFDAPRLIALPPHLLLGASALTDIYFGGTALETLPADLLDHTPRLTFFTLKRSPLKTLPSGMFKAARRLQTVNLSGNKLEASALAELAPLRRLRWLDLSSNTLLGDACDVGGYSPLRNLRLLIELNLYGTAVSRVCRDWPSLPNLEILDLTDTRVIGPVSPYIR